MVQASVTAVVVPVRLWTRFGSRGALPKAPSRLSGSVFSLLFSFPPVSMSQGDVRLIYSCYTLLNSLSLFRVLQCISVSCGHRHTLVNTESKRVFAFGWGSGGRLGLEVSGTAGYGIGVLSPGSRCVCACACAWACPCTCAILYPRTYFSFHTLHWSTGYFYVR